MIINTKQVTINDHMSEVTHLNEGDVMFEFVSMKFSLIRGTSLLTRALNIVGNNLSA